MAQQTITALYDRYEDATAAVGKLEAGGIPHGELDRVERTVLAVGGFDLLLQDEGGRRLDDLSILVLEAAYLLRGSLSSNASPIASSRGSRHNAPQARLTRRQRPSIAVA